MENSYVDLPIEIRNALRKPLPKSAIGKHPTKSFLSTIKSIYIVERLNEVFGIGGWSFIHEIVKETEKIFYDNNGNVKYKIPYVVMAGKIIVPKFNFETPIQYGGHELAGRNVEPADGYKSAVTDALSKCASFLEIGIDVFKGQPFIVYDKDGNIKPEYNYSSNTNSEPVELPKGNIQKPKHEPITCDPEVAERYKELYGRLPKKNMGTESVLASIRKKEYELSQAEKEKNSKEEVVENSPDEVIDVKTVSDYIDMIEKYTSSDKLKSDAQSIVFEAVSDGLSDEEVGLIKKKINDVYLKLKV